MYVYICICINMYTYVYIYMYMDYVDAMHLGSDCSATLHTPEPSLDSMRLLPYMGLRVCVVARTHTSAASIL